MSENTLEVKIKNPKRVSAGKKGAEAKKMKAELKRKEIESMKKENNQLREQINITKDDHEVTEVKEVNEVLRVNIYKNYIPLCVIGAVGLGIYMYKSKQVAPMIQRSEASSTKFEKKEIDPFEFN